MKKLLDVFLLVRKQESLGCISTTLKENNISINTDIHPKFGRRVTLSDGNFDLKINMEHLLKELD